MDFTQVLVCILHGRQSLEALIELIRTSIKNQPWVVVFGPIQAGAALSMGPTVDPN